MLSESRRGKSPSDKDIKCSETVTIIHNDKQDTTEDNIEVLAKEERILISVDIVEAIEKLLNVTTFEIFCFRFMLI